MQKEECIFCQIAQKKSPAHVVWEDEKNIAFLSIYPNTDGFTVVIPKNHESSYAFEVSDEVLKDLIIATKKVARKLDNAFEDVGRTGMFFEGFGVDHLHSKLFPMHGTANMDEWRPIESALDDVFFDEYPGYLSSHNAKREDDSKLAQLADKIRKAND